MRLTVLERLQLLSRGDGSILPAQGSFADMKVATALRDALQFTEAERNGPLHVREIQQGMWAWETDTPDPDAPEPAIGEEDTRKRIPLDVSASFDIGKTGDALITAGLKGLDAAAKLTANQVSLYEKFVLAKTDAASSEAAALEEPAKT